ncbi:flagellar hook-length control protein FliK [Sphingorhabdus sp. M41]|uniref:flagellar hook-length control protein FliK n=1 Tax=Sphingorhabdus sp. M41 TaxID=1806885 RepID=UPI00078B6829|nr:flagellar hook-length control protein FliK [Sphingorhabdus sp. M41]AMO72604.1 hypothetical protein AZE99_12760 [Sphingorhabdus sp. M41]
MASYLPQQQSGANTTDANANSIAQTPQLPDPHMALQAPPLEVMALPQQQSIVTSTDIAADAVADEPRLPDPGTASQAPSAEMMALPPSVAEDAGKGTGGETQTPADALNTHRPIEHIAPQTTESSEPRLQLGGDLPTAFEKYGPLHSQGATQQILPVSAPAIEPAKSDVSTDAQLPSGLQITSDNMAKLMPNTVADPASGFEIAQYLEAKHDIDKKIGDVAAARSAYPLESTPETGLITSSRGEHIGRDLGVTILRQLRNGAEEITVRLDPAELGKIHVKLQFGEDGALRVQMRADTPMALDLLKRDAGELQRSLQDAGVRTDAQGFRFEGGSSDQRHTRQQGNSHAAHPGSARHQSDDSSLPPPPHRRSMRAAAGRLDMLA